MPTVPSNTKCSHLRCNNPRTKYSSLCLEHGGRDTQKYYADKDRQEANALYQTSRWSRHRQLHLSKHPLCHACLQRGIVTPATDIDHVFAWRHLGKDAFYNNFFQCLCHECHASKSQMEKKGVYYDFRGDNRVEYRIEDYPRLAPRFLET